MKPEQAVRATQVTTRFYHNHSAPVHVGSPEDIGIKDLNRTDFGETVTIQPGAIFPRRIQ